MVGFHKSINGLTDKIIEKKDWTWISVDYNTVIVQ